MLQLKSGEDVNDERVYFTSIVNTIRKSLIILDVNLKVVSGNDAFYKLFHVVKEDTENKFIYELGSRQWELVVLKELLDKIIPVNDHFQDYMVEHTFPFIGHKIMLLSGRRINQGEGRAYLILLTIEDVTERTQEKRALEKHTSMLEDANSQLRSFDYTVSHDLRAPLNIINGYASLLLREHSLQLDDEGKRILTILNNKVKEMDTLIRDLLRFSQISMKELQVTPINMNSIAESAAAEVSASSPDRKLQVTIRQLPSARGDDSMIRQVWLNLIDNAVKFTKFQKLAVIEIGGWIDPKENVFYIKDNGIGFDMKYAKRLFSIFLSLNSSKEYAGTGTGLAIVSRVIHRHGGRVWAESKEIEGTTFYFALPGE